MLNHYLGEVIETNLISKERIGSIMYIHTTEE